MNPNPLQQGKPDAPAPSDRPGQPVQTGALPGGQPGQGVNTSGSAPGQSNADAATAQGTTYGKHDRPRD